jgi:hypothetical protein
MLNTLSSFTLAWVPGSSHAFLSLSLHFPKRELSLAVPQKTELVNELIWSLYG